MSLVQLNQVHPSCICSDLALYLSKWLETVEEEKQSGILDEEEREILGRLQDLMSQTELNIQDVRLSAVVLELGAGLLMETWVYGCKSLYFPCLF